MLFIQFILCINLILLLIDFILLIHLMPARKGRGPNGRGLRPKGPWTEAQRAEFPKTEASRPAGHSRPRDYWGEGSQPPHHQLQSGECCKLRVGVRAEPWQPNFSHSKGNFELSKKCHHVWSRPSTGSLLYKSAVGQLSSLSGRTKWHVLYRLPAIAAIFDLLDKDECCPTADLSNIGT